MSLNLVDNALHAIVILRPGNGCAGSDVDVDLLCVVTDYYDDREFSHRLCPKLCKTSTTVCAN